MHEDTIPSMVHSLQRHPEAHIVLSNTVNNPMSNWLHYSTGAIYSYLPEPASQQDQAQIPSNNGTWRASELPPYPDIDIADVFDMDTAPPFEGHRWLPLTETGRNFAKTPLNRAFYDPDSLGWKSWAFAAQQHYSLLQNIEQGTTSKYWFGNGKDGTWDMHHIRYSINMMAIWGQSVADNPPQGDDEQDLTVEIPTRIDKATLVDSRAVVAHMHFSGQQRDVMKTDLLERFRAYANEMVCSSDNHKDGIASNLS